MDALKNVALLMLVLALGEVHSVGIYGGHEAVPHSRPYMVILERLFPEQPKRHCDGFLLNEDFVMTAAHCQASSYNVLFGVHNYEKIEQNISVIQAFPHHDFMMTPVKLINDIMLLKLASKVKLGDHVKPIKLADAGEHALPHRCLVSGWGTRNRTTGFMSPILMEVNVTLSNFGYCRQCHLYCSQGYTGPATGDSGGPLVCEDGLAYGVVSFTLEQMKTSPIHAFTRIPVYRTWIEKIITA